MSCGERRRFQSKKAQLAIAKKAALDGEDLEGFYSEPILGKGRGVRTSTHRSDGAFLLQYKGELVTAVEANRREEEDASVFRYFFQFKGRNMCIDATIEPSEGTCFGRLVNHGEKREINSKMIVLDVLGSPCLCLFAIRDIDENEEILYDYGIKELPWKIPKKLRLGDLDPILDLQETVSCMKVPAVEGPSDSVQFVSKENTPEFPCSLNRSLQMISSRCLKACPIDTDINFAMERVKTDFDDIVLSKTSAHAAEVVAPQELLAEEVASPQDVLAEEVTSPQEVLAEEVTSPLELLADEVTLPQELLAEEVTSLQELLAEEVTSQQELLAEEVTSPQELLAEEVSSLLELLAEEVTSRQELLAEEVTSLQEREKYSTSIISNKKKSVSDTFSAVNCPSIGYESPRGYMVYDRHPDFSRFLKSREYLAVEQHDGMSMSLSDSFSASPHTTTHDYMTVTTSSISQATLEPTSDITSSVSNTASIVTELNSSLSVVRCHSVVALRKRSFVKLRQPDSDVDIFMDSDDSMESDYIPYSDESNSSDATCDSFDVNEPRRKVRRKAKICCSSTVSSPVIVSGLAIQHITETVSSVAGSGVETEITKVISLKSANVSMLSEISSDAEKVTVTQKASVAKRKNKPARPCPYCQKFMKRLTRHIRSVHRDLDCVKDAMMHDYIERNNRFKQFRREGIKKHNVTVIGLPNAVLQREIRKDNATDGAVCTKCSGVFSKRYFWRHRRICLAESACEVIPVPVSVFYGGNEFSATYKMQVLGRFQNDAVGQLCKSDPMICMIGFRLFNKVEAKKDKSSEVRKAVMSDMRRLATLFVKYKEVSLNLRSQSQVKLPASQNYINDNPAFVDMFKRNNFPILEQAVKEYTLKSNDAGMKSGLKINVFFLILKAAKILKAHYLVNSDDSGALEVENFTEVLKLNYNMVFGDALYEINRNRETRLRRVEQLPVLSDLQALREYTIHRMKVLLGDSFLNWTNHEYAELRDLVISRLTLFNARRGGEPARLKLDNWKDCCNGVWIDHERVVQMNDNERTLFKETMLMYQTGKGNHLVPVLVPCDTVAPLHKLSDLGVRKNCGIFLGNHYLFPSTHLSVEHVSGWHALKRVCIEAKVNASRITATKMRHRISTLYAALDVPESQRNFFFKHMGHGSSVNENIYQAPLAETEVLTVGQVLHQFDDLCAVNQNHFVYPAQAAEVTSPQELCAKEVTSPQELLAEEVTSPQELLAHEITLPQELLAEEVTSSQELLAEEVTSPQELEIGHDKLTLRSFPMNCSKVVNQHTYSVEEVFDAELPPKRRKPKTKWSQNEADIVHTYFRRWISGEKVGLPGKVDIMKFKELYPSIVYEWTIIRNKVLNSAQAFLKRRDLRAMKMSSIN